MTDTLTEQYPCPDKRCPGLVTVDILVGSTDPVTCSVCAETFQAHTVRAAPKWVDWVSTPGTTENSHVQFWSRPLKNRLEQSTLSPGQAAKRDLAAYATLIDGMLPAIHEATACALVRHLMTRRGELATPYTIIAGWHHLIDSVESLAIPGTTLYGSTASADLYLPAFLVQKYALLDAADRCIHAYDTSPRTNPYLPDLVHQFFRITPEAT